MVPKNMEGNIWKNNKCSDWQLMLHTYSLPTWADFCKTNKVPDRQCQKFLNRQWFESYDSFWSSCKWTAPLHDTQILNKG